MTYRYSVVAALLPGHAEFAVGNRVGVAAKAVISLTTPPAMGGEVKKGDPDASESDALLPIENTETDPETESPVVSIVVRFATNKNLPAESIAKAAGTTFTVSGVGAPGTATLAGLNPFVPTPDSVPSEFTLNVAIVFWLTST